MDDVVVDPEDAWLLTEYKWRAYRYGYGLRYATARIDGKTAYLHRVIAGAEAGMDVDHINGNGLDNRRCNLRVVPHQMNIANQRLSRANTTGFKGVTKIRRYAGSICYEAKTKFKGEMIHGGRYDTPEEAAAAYDRLVRQLFGPHARTNADLGLIP